MGDLSQWLRFWLPAEAADLPIFASHRSGLLCPDQGQSLKCVLQLLRVAYSCTTICVLQHSEIGSLYSMSYRYAAVMTVGPVRSEAYKCKVMMMMMMTMTMIMMMMLFRPVYTTACRVWHGPSQ